MRWVGAFAVLLTACAGGATVRPSLDGVAREPAPIPASPEAKSSGPKYYFFFIGDGMGQGQIRSAELFQSVTAGEADAGLSFTGLEVRAMVTTYAEGAPTTDSAAAGTALASGHKTVSGAIGLKADLKTPLKSIAYVAKEQGKRVGILSSVSLDHATPAAFYAHQPSRHDYGALAGQAPASGFDLFAGGGLLAAVREEGGDALWTTITEHGYQLARTRAEQDRVRLPAFIVDDQLDEDAALPYAIDRVPNTRRLADYTRQAVELLDSDAGFFVMVEGGKIDWACHANDAVASIYETLEFSAAVAVGVEFMERRPEQTLIVVTADHETGGMAVVHGTTGYRPYIERLRRQKASFRRFQGLVKDRLVKHPAAELEELEPLIEEYWGLTLAPSASADASVVVDEHTAVEDAASWTLSAGERAELGAAFVVNRERIERHRTASTLDLAAREHDPFTRTLTRLFDRRAGIHWTTRHHTAAPVPVFAAGVGQQRFAAVKDNTEIARVLVELMAASGDERADQVPAR